MFAQKPKTSTPNASKLEMRDAGQSPDVSVILLEQPTSATVLIADDSISNLEDMVLQQCDCIPGSHSSIARLEEKFMKQYSHEHGKSVRIQAPEEDQELKCERSTASNGRGVGAARVCESQSASTLQGQCPTQIKSEHKQRPNVQESIGRSSEVDSPSSSCASARAQYYHNKLLATLQILQNKEETVRVQTESLAVAEARIASQTARSVELKREIERKARELKTIRETLQASRKEKSDISITAQIQEVDYQKNIVTTLQNNLGVIEDLYRECFYETAKQEGLIEMLRKSYLDVRLMDKEKSDQISRLHNVINTQKWSLDKCQDIARDVDNLKVEISNFLNSSNNDSGVWEESLAGDLTEDLQDISGQLLRLRELLTGECTCGLEEENKRLRQNNEAMTNEMHDLRQKIEDLESILQNKETVDRQHLEQIRSKESELHLIRQQLTAIESDTQQKGETCESIRIQLKQTQVLLNEKTSELTRAQAQCRQNQETIHQLSEELDQTKEISREYCGAARAAQRRLRDELARAAQRCEDMDAAHRCEVEALQRALGEAQARGAALCGAARRATRRVRAWVRHRNHVQREQELQLKQKDSEIRMLEHRLEQRQNDTTLTRESEKTCPRCVSARSSDAQSFGRSQSFERMRTSEPSCSKCPQIEGSFSSSSRVRQRRDFTFETSASEVGSSPPPVPPQRPSRMRRFFCENRLFSSSRDASAQRPERQDAAGNTAPPGASPPASPPAARRRCRVGHATVHTLMRESPGSVDEVLCRVESAGAALADSLRRWSRHGTLHRT